MEPVMKRCPKCGSQIDSLWRLCTLCFYRLEEDRDSPSNNENQMRDPVVKPEETLVHKIYPYKSQTSNHNTSHNTRKEPQQKRKSLPVLSYVGLIVLIVIIGVKVVSASNSGTDHASSSISAVPTQFTQQVTAPKLIVTSTPNNDRSNSLSIPEYIRQYTNKQPPYKSGGRINLINNPEAKDVSFAELKYFILKDDTDEKEYIEGIMMCGEFAEMLHNNAEQKGIRAAFVAIDFENDTIGHALNAFKTTDKGLVYIDCTGDKRKFKTSYEKFLSTKVSSCKRDMVGYIEKGKEYGIVGIDRAELLSYKFYAEYVQNWKKLDSMIDDFNKDVDAFNRAYANKTSLPTAEYKKYEAWKAQLTGKERILIELQKKLGNCFVEPLGIVKAVNIYW